MPENSSTAKVLDAVVHRIGEDARTIARKITPLPAKRKISALLSSQVETGESTILAKTGHRFKAIKEPVFLQVRYDGIYERELSRVIQQFVSVGDVVADVGANFGWHSLGMAARVGENGRVHSFEPNIEMFSALNENLDLNDLSDRVVTHHAAVGETSGYGDLNADDGQSAIGYITARQATSVSSEGAIPILALDDALVEHFGNISFIKIDVEGFEPYVLAGMEALLATDDPPVLMVEYSPDALERQPIDRSQFLQDLRNIDAHMTLPIGGKLELVAGPPEDVVTNIFFLPKRGRFKATVKDINAGIAIAAG